MMMNKIIGIEVGGPIYRLTGLYSLCPGSFVKTHNAWIQCADPLTVAQLEHVTGTLQTTFTTAFTTVLMTVDRSYDS